MYPYLEIGSASISLYKAMYVVGIIGMFVICVLSRKKYKTNLLRAIIYTFITFVSGVAGAKLMSKIYVASLSAASGGEYVPNSGVCLFGALMFLPVFMIVLSLISGEKFRKLMDYMTPGIFFILACAKSGCLLEGCCYGIADENGIYNHNLDYLVFPVQLYESLCTFAVVLLLLVIMCKRGKVRYGALYPAGTILYCAARFAWENYRYYEFECEKEFFLGLTYWQCWAIIAIIVSAVWLTVLYLKPQFKECVIEPVNVIAKLKGVESKRTEENRKKHAEKAKEYTKKANELKKNAENKKK